MSLKGEKSGNFSENLLRGRFTAVVEVNAPDAEQRFELATRPAINLADYVEKSSFISAMLVLDRMRGEDCHDPVRIGEVLKQKSNKSVFFTLCGKGTSVERAKDLLARAQSAKLDGLVAVTGNRSERHPTNKRFGIVEKHESGYLDSVSILNLARDYELSRGATVNPFKYVPEDLHLQYLKMVRKLNCGAEFLVVQTGWDMAKLQELQWYMQRRELNFPVLARVSLLSQKQIQGIHNGFLPGVSIPRVLAAMLQRESTMSAAQCMSAQLERVALQIVGCRVLGFNGVVISGINESSVLEMVEKRVAQAFARLNNYELWLDAWQDFHAGLEFSPISSHIAYYIFDGLLSSAQPRYEPDNCRERNVKMPQPLRSDKIRAGAGRFALGDKGPALLRKIVRRWIGVDDSARFCCSIPSTRCPKRLVYGACGGSSPLGECEFGDEQCHFERVFRIVNARGELDLLEINPDTVEFAEKSGERR